MKRKFQHIAYLLMVAAVLTSCGEKKQTSEFPDWAWADFQRPEGGRRLAAFWLAEAGQQQRVRPEPVGRGAVDLCSIIQNFGRMFHRQCADSSQKNNRNCSRNLCKNKKQQTRLNRSAALDALFRQCR